MISLLQEILILDNLEVRALNPCLVNPIDYVKICKCCSMCCGHLDFGTLIVDPWDLRSFCWSARYQLGTGKVCIYGGGSP